MLHKKSELANLNNKVDVVIMHKQKVKPINMLLESFFQDAGDVAAVR